MFVSAAGTALDDAAFARRMAPLGPFEAAPRIAVGVSGGADSLALALLLDRWCRDRGGHVLALTVDHRLRPESTAETAQVGAWMAARGITWRGLAWEGEKPATGIQEAAREARHSLLRRACREAGILTLALAHHRDDQAETYLLRAAMRSGPDGLAAMASVRETAETRLIRPLLDVPKSMLVATVRAAGQPWIEDPSNLSRRFARGRLRTAGPAGEGQAVVADPAASAGQAGLARAALDRDAAGLLARHASLYPEGWVELDRAALAGGEPDLALRLVRSILAIVGGRPYPPRRERLQRLATALREGAGAGFSLAGCLVSPTARAWRFCREPADVGPDLRLNPGDSGVWDGRFRIAWDGPAPVRVGALGVAGWIQVKAARPLLVRSVLPAAVRRTLPALWWDDRVLIVPHLNYVCIGTDDVRCSITPAPPEPACGPCFSVVRPAGDII